MNQILFLLKPKNEIKPDQIFENIEWDSDLCFPMS